MHSMHGVNESCKCVKEAETYLLKSVTCSESMFDDLAHDQDKISILETYRYSYKLLEFVYSQCGQGDQALLVSDRGRARALGELLNLRYDIDEDTAKDSHLTMDDVKQLLSRLDICILFYSLQLDDTAVGIWVLTMETPMTLVDSKTRVPDPSEEGCTEIQDGSKETKGVKEAYTVTHEDMHNLDSLVEHAYHDMKVREIKNCEDRSVSPVHESDDLLPKHAEQNEKLDSRHVYFEPDEREKPLKLLFDQLITPVIDHLVDDELVVIPDGPLFMVPFAALQDPQTGQFLSEIKRIRLAPSLSILKVLEESCTRYHEESGALIVGNPKVGEVIFGGHKRYISDLPGAEDEVRGIGKLLGVEPLTGKKATKRLILQKLQVGVSVIHFAAHGSENGKILLAPSDPSPGDNTPEEEDYVLTMREAQEIGTRAQLVVLSCCHSGRGEIKSEGVVGMSRAFLAAGARSVVASLWAIADDATKVFMLKFYSYLKKGESASTSLQQAMREMREMGQYKEPRHWAAFFLIGDDVTISV